MWQPDDLSTDLVRKALRWGNYFDGNDQRNEGYDNDQDDDVRPHGDDYESLATDQESSTSDDEWRESWYNDLNNPDGIAMIRDYLPDGNSDYE